MELLSKKICQEKGITLVGDVPEKVLQFGTGVLLRCLPDYYIDKANKQGEFNGKIVIVKSTSNGNNDDWAEQDFLFTQQIKGLVNGQLHEETIVNSSVSRSLAANTEWDKILACAANPDINIIISNTTENGLQYLEEKINKAVGEGSDTQICPISFPGKLTAYLYKRFREFEGDEAYAPIIIPTELDEYNGDKLKDFVNKNIVYNDLGEDFTKWIAACKFCNSLVDRIVPGKPANAKEIEALLGYRDEYITASEPYTLWAIQGDDKVKEALTFAKCDEGVKIVSDIAIFKELKLRLLNATHILACAHAIQKGHRTVKDAMQDAAFNQEVIEVMEDIKVGIPMEIDQATKDEFASSVVDRFSNPFIEHQWKDITLNFTTKMIVRSFPLIKTYLYHRGSLPSKIVKGFTHYLNFMYDLALEEGKYYYTSANGKFEVKDQLASRFYNNGLSKEAWLDKVLNDNEIWGEDINKIGNLKKEVKAIF